MVIGAGALAACQPAPMPLTGPELPVENTPSAPTPTIRVAPALPTPFPSATPDPAQAIALFAERLSFSGTPQYRALCHGPYESAWVAEVSGKAHALTLFDGAN